MEYTVLMQLAEKARENAYAPYSHFRVGAAVLCTNGKVYTGCNVENVSYGGTVCAERTAMLKAISEAEREFAAIAITGAKEGEKGGFCAPCGICRQFMAEFCGEDTDVILGNEEKLLVYKLSELLPLGFSLPD